MSRSLAQGATAPARLTDPLKHPPSPAHTARQDDVPGWGIGRKHRRILRDRRTEMSANLLKDGRHPSPSLHARATSQFSPQALAPAGSPPSVRRPRFEIDVPPTKSTSCSASDILNEKEWGGSWRKSSNGGRVESWQRQEPVWPQGEASATQQKKSGRSQWSALVWIPCRTVWGGTYGWGESG